MNYKVIVLVILTIVFLYRFWLTILKYQSHKNPIPDNVKDIYDADSYQKWKSYHFEKTRLSLFSALVSYAADLVLIGFNLYAAFAGLFTKDPYSQAVGVLLLSALTAIIELPFSYYDTMVIEQKYGFNRSDKKTFFLDQIKEFIISFAVIAGIGCLLTWTNLTLGDWLIIAFAVIMTLGLLLIAFLFPYFGKIFNKFTPLEEGELKEKVTALLEKHGYKVRAIQVMDASRRSTKSNAYFSGFGKTKTIVLYDTLVASMTPDEICAVFAHEMGHGLHKDTLRNQLLSFVQMVILAVLAWLTVRSSTLFIPFGFTEVNYGFAIILIMSVEFALVAPLFSLLTSYFSRKAEYLADKQAVLEGYGDALISGLKKLAKENFSDLSPSPIVVKLEYSHPTLSQRITAIEREMENAKKGK